MQTQSSFNRSSPSPNPPQKTHPPLLFSNPHSYFHPPNLHEENLTQLNFIIEIFPPKRYRMQHQTSKMVKVLYLNELQQWTEYTEATLRLQTRDEQGLNLLLALSEPLPPSKLAILPLIQIYRQKQGTICIGMEVISQIERLDELVLAIKLEEWNRVLSLSFRDEDYCSIILEQIELEISITNQLPCKPEELIKYISTEMDGSPHFVDWIFENATVLHQFFSYIESNWQNLGERGERCVFKIVKAVFMRCHKNIFEMFLKDEYFLTVLRCLSYNYEFGDRRVDYLGEFLRISKCANILEFQEEHIIKHYSDIMKARYLIDYPTSMFIELNTQVVLNEIIREKTLAIIQILIEHPDFFGRYKELALVDPVIFIELFSQLWEMFKLVVEDSRTNGIKASFHFLFLTENLLEITFECVQKVTRDNKADPRLYQKFLESLNPFLSYNWIQSQDYLLSFFQISETHLLGILLDILRIADYNTKSIVYNFARYLIESTQSRKVMKQAFISYFFSEFVSKIQYFSTSVEELQVYVGFMLRCYKIDHIRTRRCMISETGLIGRLEEMEDHSKFVQILILRFLRTLLETPYDQVFIYLERHEKFTNLREAYFQSKKFTPRGILSSMFVGLLKDCEKSSNRQGVRYIYGIMLPLDEDES